MKKIASLTVALLLVAGVFGAVTASAATVAELQAMIAQLQAQLSALGGGSVSTGATTFTKNLSVGSRGAEVSALQEALNTEVDAGLPVTGYFGAMTRAAVVKFQKANGISGTGTVGPLTREALNALQAPVSNTGTGTTGTGTTGSTVADGTDGSVNAALSPAVSTSQTLKKGETKDVYAVSLTATGGAVNVNRLDVHFTVRPWLLFSTVTLKDNSGAVIATKNLTSAADVTEITAGSDYAVRFDGLSVVVTPGQTTTLKVGVSVPANNSFVGTTGYTSVGVYVQTNGIRTINGKGYTDSTGLAAAGAAVGGSNVNTLTLTSTGSNADWSVTLAPSSPLAGPVPVSTTVTTNGVKLSSYRIKSVNQPSTLNTMVVDLAPALVTAYGSNVTAALLNPTLKDEATGQTYGATTYTTAGKVTFSTLNIPLALDTPKDFSILVDVAATSTAFTASTSLDVSGFSAVDANYNTPTISGSAFSAATDVAGADITLTANSLSATASAINTVAVNNGQNPTVAYDASFSVTLSNASGNNLFVGKGNGTGVANGGGDMFSTTTSPTDATTTIIGVTLPNGTLAGDTTTAWVIPAGASRVFNVQAKIAKHAYNSGSQTLTISAINYGTAAATPSGSTITTGISNLTKTVTFSGNF